MLNRFWLIPGLYDKALTLFRMGIFGAAHRLGVKKAPPPYNLSHISYNDETWNSYILPKEDPKKIWITWHNPWVLVTSTFFHRKSANFVLPRNTDIDWMGIFGVTDWMRFNPIQDGHFWGRSRMGRGVAKKAPSLKNITHIVKWWNLAQLYLTWRRSKNIYELRETSPEFYWQRQFFTGNQQILLYQEIKIKTAFW